MSKLILSPSTGDYFKRKEFTLIQKGLACEGEQVLKGANREFSSL